MKRTIQVMVEIDVEFIDDVYLARAAELGNLIGNGITLDRNVRAVVGQDEAVEHLEEPRLQYRGFKL